MILACGDVHKRVLQMSKNLHPLIYLKGFQSKDFLSILDFLYFGGANAYMHCIYVYQEDLESFFAKTIMFVLKF